MGIYRVICPPERCDLNRLNQPLLQLLLSNGIHMHISVGHMIVLKIIQKVSFNIASEESYVNIFRGERS